MPSDFTNQCVLITGGKRIGAAIATELSARGMDVALSFNRSRMEAEQAAAAVRSAGRRAFVLKPIYHERKRRRSWTGARPTLDGSMC